MTAVATPTTRAALKSAGSILIVWLPSVVKYPTEPPYTPIRSQYATIANATALGGLGAGGLSEPLMAASGFAADGVALVNRVAPASTLIDSRHLPDFSTSSHLAQRSFAPNRQRVIHVGFSFADLPGRNGDGSLASQQR